jgi:hypothetical protein
MCKSEQQTKKKNVWGRFKNRARNLKTEHSNDCACPPNDWTVDLGQNNPQR